LENDHSSSNVQPLEIPGASRPGLVTKNGLVLFGNDGKTVRHEEIFFIYAIIIVKLDKEKT